MRHRPILRVALIGGFFLALVLWLHWSVFTPIHAAPNNSSEPLTVAQTLPLAMLLALALGTLTSLFISNVRRLRAVLRPTLWRVLPAMLMAGLTPIAVFNWVPWLAGALIGMGVLSFPGQDIGAYLRILATILGVSAVLTLIWYLPSSLIISGVKNKLLRVALFALMWWACYAAHLLIGGDITFHL